MRDQKWGSRATSKCCRGREDGGRAQEAKAGHGLQVARCGRIRSARPYSRPPQPSLGVHGCDARLAVDDAEEAADSHRPARASAPRSPRGSA
eukprot:1323763-Rhodomonas_salina.1